MPGFEPDTFEDLDFENFAENLLEPITQVKSEENYVSAAAAEISAEISPQLILHKLDEFIVQKFLKTDKNFLKTRYLSQLVFMQEKAEETKNLTKPVELEDGSLMCHKCMRIYKTKKALSRHLREFHNRSRLAKCDKCDYIGATPGALTYHIQTMHLNMHR